MMKRVILAILFAVFSFPACAFAAISFDTAGSGTTAGVAATTLTTSLTLAASDFLVVNAGATRQNFTGCSSITAAWNGTSMNTEVTDLRGGSWLFGTFYLANAASGTHNLVITLNGCSSNSHIALVYAAYSGMSTTGQPDSTTDTQNAGGTTNLSTSATLSAANGWSIAAAGNNNNRTITNSSNVTNIRASVSMTDPGSGETEKLLIGDGGVIGSSGSYTQSVNFSGNTDTNNLSLLAIIPPSAGGGVSTPSLARAQWLY